MYNSNNPIEPRLKDISMLVTDCLFNPKLNLHVVALTATFGDGKTIFAKEFKDKNLKINDKEVMIVYCNIWKYSYLTPLLNIFTSLEQKFGNLSDEEETKNILNDIFKYVCDIDFLKSGENYLGICKKTKTTATYEKFRELIRNDPINKLKETLKKLALKHTILFLIDEMDRCEIDYVHDYLKILHHFFYIDNIRFLLFTNNDYLNKLDFVNDKKASFIQKFIDFRLPLYLNDIKYRSVTTNYGTGDGNGNIHRGNIITNIIKKNKLLLNEENSKFVLNDKHIDIIRDIQVIFNLSLRDIEQIIKQYYLLINIKYPKRSGSLRLQRLNALLENINSIIVLFALKQNNYSMFLKIFTFEYNEVKKYLVDIIYSTLPTYTDDEKNIFDNNVGILEKFTNYREKETNSVALKAIVELWIKIDLYHMTICYNRSIVEIDLFQFDESYTSEKIEELMEAINYLNMSKT